MKNIFVFYKRLLYANRFWIFAVASLAVIWTVAGFLLSVAFPQVFLLFFARLSDTFDMILGGVEPGANLEFTRVLFVQNFLASFYSLFLGALLGLVPVLSVAVNFFALGFLAGPFAFPLRFTNTADVSLITFITAILPHGVFEIPALLLAAAFGLRLGWSWLLPGAAGRRRAVFKQAAGDALKLLPLVFLLLLVAAFMEAYVTGRIVGY